MSFLFPKQFYADQSVRSPKRLMRRSVAGSDWMRRTVTRPVNFGAEMTPEQKLWMCVLLQGIAETDRRFVKGDAAKYVKDRGRTDAVKFVASEDFENICSVVNVSPEFMRAVDPAKAFDGLGILLRQAKDQTPTEATCK